MKHLLICLALLGSMLVAGCDKPPQVVGTVTVSVANQLGGGALSEAAWSAGLAWINTQLAAEGIQVNLVSANQGRGDAVQAIVTDVRPEASQDGTLVLVVDPGGDWKQQALDQALAAFGKR